MPKKYVKLADEKHFLIQSRLAKDAETELTKLKKKFIRLFDKGYLFKILTPRPCPEGRVSIDWQTEAYALSDQYMTVKEKGKWLLRVNKKYKPTPVATSFILPKGGTWPPTEGE